jgi:ribonuclease T
MMADRFRGFLPVVIDVETGGFDARVNPILEIAAVQVSYENRELVISERWSRAVRPFPGGRSDAAALRFTGIDPDDPMRCAIMTAHAPFWSLTMRRSIRAFSTRRSRGPVSNATRSIRSAVSIPHLLRLSPTGTRC